MKQKIYIALVTLLGILFGTLVTSLIETQLIYASLSSGHIPASYGDNFYLSPFLSLGILIAATVGGFLLGHSWWRYVYVERRHWSDGVAKSSKPAKTVTKVKTKSVSKKKNRR